MRTHFDRRAPVHGRPGISGRQLLISFVDVVLNMPEADVNPKVLIADDERVIADTLVAILTHEGFEARAAYSSAQAMDIALAFKPDLLISDVIMEEMSGIEAAIRIKAMLPDIRVFLLSGQTTTPELLEKEKADGYGFEVIIKPVHPRDLISRLRECMAT
jgi:CheY-like chemotaxis protein